MDESPYTSATPARSSDETQPYDSPGAEVPRGMEDLTTWDEPPTQKGLRHVPSPPEPDSPALELVEEGVEEADRELRLEAVTADEDPTVEP
ncbi:MAG TPA: hypothetical protein VG796_14940 [Verrucomicrobiales bacterium]|nr:hypothetical protein [Verrucomicrobiales bacterium]